MAKLAPHMATAMIFIILNSLQGMLIFVFHVALGPRCKSRVRREITSRFGDSDLSKSNNQSKVPPGSS